MEGNNNEDQGEAAVNQVLDDAVIFQDLENNPLLPLPNPVPQIVHFFPEINQNNELVAPEILASETILESSSPLHEADLPLPSEPNYMQLTVQPCAAHHSYPGQAVMLPFGLYPSQAVMLPFGLYPPQQLVLQVPPPPPLVMLVPLINYFPPQPVAIYIFYPGQAMMPHFRAQFEPPPPGTEPVRAQLYPSIFLNSSSCTTQLYHPSILLNSSSCTTQLYHPSILLNSSSCTKSHLLHHLSCCLLLWRMKMKRSLRHRLSHSELHGLVQVRVRVKPLIGSLIMQGRIVASFILLFSILLCFRLSSLKTLIVCLKARLRDS